METVSLVVVLVDGQAEAIGLFDFHFDDLALASQEPVPANELVAESRLEAPLGPIQQNEALQGEPFLFEEKAGGESGDRQAQATMLVAAGKDPVRALLLRRLRGLVDHGVEFREDVLLF